MSRTQVSLISVVFMHVSCARFGMLFNVSREIKLNGWLSLSNICRSHHPLGEKEECPIERKQIIWKGKKSLKNRGVIAGENGLITVTEDAARTERSVTE